MALEDVLKKYKDFINIDTPKYYFPSSLLSINMLSGSVKGIKSGRVVQILGDKGTGKSSLCLDIIANAQKENHTCVYFDVERTLDEDHARILGVDLEKLYIIKTDTAEESLEVSEAFIKADVKVIVIDSLPMLLPKLELEKTMNESEKMAGSAGLITRYIKRITPMIDNHGTLVLLVNQYRANFSTLSRKAYKPFGPEIMTYGNSLTLELTRIKNGEHEAVVEAFVEKNKLAGTERQKAEYTLIHGKGFDVKSDILTLALERDIVTQKGKGHYYYENIHAHGLEQAKEMFPFDEIRRKVLELE